MKKRKKIIKLAIILSLSFYFFFKKKFTPEKWRDMESNNRYLLVESLNEQYELLGMKCEEVKTLLGEPDLFEGNTEKGELIYKYYIKSDVIHGLLWLEIFFDKNIVYNYKLLSDDWQ